MAICSTSPGIADRVTYHVADVGRDPLIDHLVAGRDYIFNLAGSISHVHSMLDPGRDLDLNCATQLTLLEACRRFNPSVKIVFTSTRQVYGKPLYLPVDEQHRLAPPDINGIHKLTAEHYHLLYHRIYGLCSVVLRLTNVYGPRQLMRHSRQSFIAWFIRQAIDGGVIELFGDGRQRRDLNYVDDVVEALLLAGASEAADGEIFNLGGAEPMSVAELAERLITLTGRGLAQRGPVSVRSSIDRHRQFLFELSKDRGSPRVAAAHVARGGTSVHGRLLSGTPRALLDP